MAADAQNKKVFETLRRYTEIDENISFLRKCIDNLEDEYYNSANAVKYDGLPKGKKKVSKTEKMALDIPSGISDEIKIYEKKVKEYQCLKTEILREISRLEYKQKTIIFDRYIKGLKWEKVAVRNHYTERHCRNISRDAVKILAKNFAKNTVISNFDAGIG